MLSGCHVDGLKPDVEKLRPFCDGKLCATQAECVTALRVEVHLYRDAGSSETGVVREGLFNSIDLVVLILQDERGRCCLREMCLDIGREREAVLVDGQMSRINCDGKVRAAAYPVCGVMWARISGLSVKRSFPKARCPG